MQIIWKPTLKQMQAFEVLQDKTTTELFYGGGAGGGKTYMGCVWVILGCLQYPGSRWLMGRANLKTLKQTTLLTFFDICKAWGLKAVRDYKYNSVDGVIKWANESEVYLKDLFCYPKDPEFDSLGSTEYTGAFIDEASQIKSKAKNIVMSRIRYKLDEFNLIPKLLITSNPSKNFLYKEFYKPWKDNTIVPYRKFIPSLVQDNPYISKHYIENLKKLDKISKERLLYGNFEYDDDPAKLFEYDKILDLFTNTVPASEKRYITCDVARKGKDKTTIGYWEGLWLKEIIYYQGRTTDETQAKIEEIAAKRMVPRSQIVADEDGVGGGVVDNMKGIKGFINNSSQIKIPGIVTNYRNLKSQCYFYLADYVDKAKIAIQSRDEQVREWIIEELEQIKQKNIDKDGAIEVIGKDAIKENIGRSPDFADMIMMRMLFELPQGTMSILSDPSNLFGLG